jgi:2,5-diamino-6-(ribosylamino)-4(3H)-pyrimidinone 5'-phosphate reductase
MKRPHVILSAAMTLDGKIATTGGDSKISCDADLIRLHRLRSKVDAVMVGVGTVLADDPSLTVRRVRGKNPVRVVVDGKGKTPATARVLRENAKTIIAVSRGAKREKIEKLRSTGAEIIVAGERRVNLRRLLNRLWSAGIRRLLLEGGSTLNWNMLKEGLVDEIRVCIAPYVVGGENAKTLVGGRGFPRIKRGVKLRLKKTGRVGSDLLLIYRVEGRKC